MPPSATRLKTLSKRKAEFIEPMDCAPIPHLPDGSQWVFEIKLDGYRAIAVKVDGRVNLCSRRHKSFNHQYLHLVEALGELPEGTVVDGEVVALDELGRPNFNLLQNFRHEASSPAREWLIATNEPSLAWPSGRAKEVRTLEGKLVVFLDTTKGDTRGGDACCRLRPSKTCRNIQANSTRRRERG